MPDTNSLDGLLIYTQRHPTQTIYDHSITPISRILRMRWRDTELCWQYPIAIDVTNTQGNTYKQSIYHSTRISLIMLSIITLCCTVGLWKIVKK